MSGDTAKDKIDFVIVGGQKCGTTLALDMMRVHPDLFMPDGETTLFDRARDDLDRDIAQFFLGVPDEKRGKQVGIKRPTYLTNEEVPARIHHHNPHVKIIAMVRNPMERARAAYFHMIKSAQLPVLDFETGMNAILDGGFGPEVPLSQTVLTMSFQGRGLNRYVDLFGRSQVHACLFDDLKTDFDGLFTRMHLFLGVNPMDLSQWHDHRPQEVIYSIERLKWLSQAAPHRYHLNEFGIAVRRKTDHTPEDIHKIEMIEMTDHVRMEPKYGNAKPTPSPALWQRMYDLFKNDITVTEHLLQRDLSSWRQPPST